VPTDDYYNPAFRFCQPEGGPKAQPERLGSILFGDRIFNSAFDVRPLFLSVMVSLTLAFTKIKMLQDDGVCKKLCTVTNIPPDNAKFINERIREDYALNWLVDGLPAAEKKVDNKTGDIFYDMGFNLGIDDDDFYANPALNNHYEILLEYHTPASGQHRVVGVVVWPSR
jgi:transmembrane 9 superfamily protein 2/4